MKKCLFVLFFLGIIVGNLRAQKNVEKWNVFETEFNGPESGNPFVGISLWAEFKNGNEMHKVEGFYDGNGTFKIRFMPEKEGTWSYITHSNRGTLDGLKGTFDCVSPSEDNDGPVRVHNKYHFAYADSARFIPFGTTIYEWPYQSDSARKKTIQTLKKSPFNKVRFLVIPPYNDRYVKGPLKITDFPFEGTSVDSWNFARFNPDFFSKLETCIKQLRDIGVQADLILFRPYDSEEWGFDKMTQETNKRFVRYVVARFSAYRNVWWSLANENSFIDSITDKEWDELFKEVRDDDPYGHLRSIHNAGRIYNYKKSWVTHVSLQYYNAVRKMGVTPLLRDIYKKPIVYDEINYEGNISRRWGQLSGEEMTYRFWIAYIGGGYATHGETFKSNGWSGVGGKLIGESPARIAFLKKIVEDAPQLDPIDQYYKLNIAGKEGEYYLIYFGKEKPGKWEFKLPDNGLEEGSKFKVDIIDTWNMTIKTVDKIFEVKQLDRYSFIDKNHGAINLPEKPYMAIRIRKIN